MGSALFNYRMFRLVAIFAIFAIFVKADEIADQNGLQNQHVEKMSVEDINELIYRTYKMYRTLESIAKVREPTLAFQEYPIKNWGFWQMLSEVYDNLNNQTTKVASWTSVSDSKETSCHETHFRIRFSNF